MRKPWTFQAEANCFGTDTEAFFPEKNVWGWDNRLAKELCQSCMVKKECLDYALLYPDLEGIWGGTNRRQRQRIRKQLNIKPIASQRIGK